MSILDELQETLGRVGGECRPAERWYPSHAESRAARSQSVPPDALRFWANHGTVGAIKITSFTVQAFVGPRQHPRTPDSPVKLLILSGAVRKSRSKEHASIPTSACGVKSGSPTS